LKYFRDEYEAHIEQKQCPAFVCRALFHFSIDRDECAQCGECEEACPSDAISADETTAELSINDDVCTRCGRCVEVCPSEAITKVPGKEHV